jgi:hypothetical protein
VTTVQAMVRAAWLEFRVSKQCSPMLDGWLAIESVDVPPWFFANELGFGQHQGPSILCLFEDDLPQSATKTQTQQK